jgi:hypothetical protein
MALSENFKKSSYSVDGTCVQVAMRSGNILVGDTKDQGGVPLQFNSAEWNAFVAGVKAGEFDI